RPIPSTPSPSASSSIDPARSAPFSRAPSACRSSRPPSARSPKADTTTRVGDEELLSMLAAEAERRGPTIIDGIQELATSGKKDPDRIEQMRVEAHGLKGAALVVGQERLAD